VPTSSPAISRNESSIAQTDPNTPSGEALRAAAIEAARRDARTPPGKTLFSAQPPASPLARALTPPAAGERLLGENAIQLTTADGRVHCLQRMPEVVARDIPGGSGAVAIPVTCPKHF
jgi:hypothetical protein